MRLGILGGGQLGRMMALAGHPLGVRCRLLDPKDPSSSRGVAEVLAERYDDPDALDRFVTGLDAVTYEFENVDAFALEHLEERVPVRPGRAALEVAQDRLTEKSFFRDHDIDTAPFAAADTLPELRSAVREVGLPAVLKTRRFGYDGKGQAVLRRPEDVEAAWNDVGGVPLLLEGFVDFDRELSILSVRDPDGVIAFYPLVENHHEDGILRLSYAPAPHLTGPLTERARRYATRVLEDLDYVGVLAIELFQVGDRLLANEMAPRVHNSGHWSIEGAETSQFENHVRAVLGLPLGSTAMRGHAAMVNLIGAVPETADILRHPDVHLHLYGKEPRPGRKVGHMTVRHEDPAVVREHVEALRALEGAHP
ncbi:MAG: 5-(carboxyamino)imidazole ribonucleotide synthase [Gemmatimonadetes bacterium]|nr:5-(carboxyamino)imidazole ribonucleotide synthase [Gemmatimonadota bacterium]NIQ53025.1 5-(carboxyamino)imidazole ribonucleotide synthase [Gemmatimonadota bacterium]NIU73169.1 5-(carboxyamino)imidazole ribonucleotide synthase [Gammaproteobacteria bacterium]NIX43463.1 5-(carboxyamino)imidazole ribonucleotide synthase [Gemmatimonadota bacterium]NIY07637.1 5-(carboxyamino)imidazole ribonucleotide synthase [Gemmatimonadota bacterium]